MSTSHGVARYIEEYVLESCGKSDREQSSDARHAKNEQEMKEKCLKNIKRFVKDGGSTAVEETVLILMDIASKIWLPSNDSGSSVKISVKKKATDSAKGKARQQRKYSYKQVLDLADALFARSKEFRLSLSRNERFQKILVQGLVDPNQAASTSSLESAKRRESLLHFIAKWDKEYGEFVPQLRVAVKHLKEDLGISFPGDGHRSGSGSDQGLAYKGSSNVIIAKFEEIRAKMNVSDPKSPIREIITHLEEAEQIIKSTVSTVFSDIFFPSGSSDQASSNSNKKRDREDGNNGQDSRNSKRIMAEETTGDDDDDDIRWDDEESVSIEPMTNESLQDSMHHLPDDYELDISFDPSRKGENSRYMLRLEEIKNLMQTRFRIVVESWVKSLKEIDLSLVKEDGREITSEKLAKWKVDRQLLIDAAMELIEDIDSLIERCKRMSL